MTTESVRDVLRLLEDGYTMLQAVEYSDRQAPYKLVKRVAGYNEKVTPTTARAVIASGRVLFSQTTNWRRWVIKR
jgi:hypothetical protein